MNNCIFCKIIQKQIPAAVILETETAIVIKDINPKASIHYLIIPKKHVADVQSLQSADLSIAQELFAIAQQISKNETTARDFRLVINSGKGAGQEVFHLHVHFLAGKTQVHL